MNERTPCRRGRMLRGGRVVLAGLGLLCLLGFMGADGGDASFRDGVRAYEQGEYVRARAIFRSLVEADSARIHETYGAAAYWLGRTYKALGNPDSMRRVWDRGVRALRDTSRFDARLFDAVLWSRWGRSGADRQRLVSLYRALIRHAGAGRGEQGRTLLRRHVAQLAPLLNAAQRKRVFVEPEAQAPATHGLVADSGPWLVAWWRRQDPLPSTAENERIEVHLERVAHARTHFSSDERLAGWDERGTLYVRYGPPARKHRIPFDDLKFLREVIRLGVGVGRGDFPKNEIWRYPQVGEKGAYLFVQDDDGHFQLGTATDLLPSELRGQFSAARRSQSRAYSSLAALRYIYRHLSMHYRDPGNVYDDLKAYFNAQDHLAAIQALRGNDGGGGTIGSGSGERRVFFGPGSTRQPPSTVANTAVRESEYHEQLFVRRREKNMPQQHSQLSVADTQLPVAVRTARFLTEKGRTRTEVYWGGPLVPSEQAEDDDSGRYVLRFSAVRYDQNYRRQEMQSEQYVLQGTSAGGAGRISPRRTTLGGTTTPYHLALQWDRFQAQQNGGTLSLGDSQGRTVMRIDSLRPLRTNPSRLGMSDIRLMAVPEKKLAGGSLLDQATPYPYTSVNDRIPLLLYFEIYHLTYNKEDRTRYVVEYRVKQEAEKGFLSKLFGDGEREERMETATTYTGTQRRTEEHVLLEWPNKVKQERSVTVTVQVTDKTSGQTVERSIPLVRRPPSSKN